MRLLKGVLAGLMLAAALAPALARDAGPASASALALASAPASAAGASVAASIPAPLAPAAHSGAPIPFKQDKQRGETDPSRLGAAVLIVLLGLGAGLYALRYKLRLSSTPAPLKLLRVLDTRRLTPRASLHVVEFAGSQYLLAHSEQGVVCIAAVAGPTPSEPT
ncbi:flagellar biosynthetic protein FliO [Massilia antarctica]|uniref:Flagellar biosynthetic protein FliO n=1 Tax=Massilia antarctica TaxID=2765360 RepID=A0AA48WAU0_9BURK|nr:flagellar biosynthetic protein FliO [Massilia antarctica]QPI48561.1 flagellar biosynthetic protein FliO [Massilia antarctica]